MGKSKLSPKENYLRLTRGEIPEFIPLHTMGFPGFNNETAYRIVGPFLFDETRLTPAPEGRTDIWGVKIVANRETGFGSIPEPGNFILDDIRKWKDVLKLPKLPESIDWEQMAKKDYEKVGIDTTQSAAMAVIGVMPFQTLMAFMGFTEGLCAMAEEPETVKELFDYMVKLYLPLVQGAVDYYNPDMIYLLDDTATNTNPFISKEMYRDILKPVYTQLTKPAVERGIPVQFHNCGRCEDFIDDMIDFGVKIMDPSQNTNHLLDIKKKYGNKFALAGCYKWQVPLNWPEVNEEEIRQSVRDCIDTFSTGGGYAFSGGALAIPGDEVLAKVNVWIREEAYYYGRDYYLNH
jgi:hypothetical protein